jgi:predicted AAA+ superfamily ATPase
MHPRSRHITQILLKRAKIFPVLGVLGARQVGKSTFLMNQWCQLEEANYITFDEKEVARRAQRAPAQLLIDESKNQKTHLIIDEAQKVPHIFDSIKALVDKKRRNGAFALSGSVEFSVKSGVRESLAGRMGVTKLYPMTLRELSNHDFIAPWVTFNFSPKQTVDPKSVETWLQRGGMPIFCRLSNLDERIGLINSWVEAICYKDIKQLKDAVYNSEIAYNLLLHLSAESLISFAELASELGTSAENIKKHLEALESLFLIYKLPSFENSRGRPMYKIFDAGVLNALRGGQATIASRHASLVSLLINEIYAQYEYAGKLKPELSHYRTRGGAAIDLVLKTKDKLVGIECVTSDDISPYRQRGMKSFLEKHSNAIGYFIAPVQKAFSIDNNIQVIPWNNIG